MVERRAVRFVLNDYTRFSHVSPLIKALGWDSLEYRGLTNQVLMFYKIYVGLVGISLPPEVSCNTRASSEGRSQGGFWGARDPHFASLF